MSDFPQQAASWGLEAEDLHILYLSRHRAEQVFKRQVLM